MLSEYRAEFTNENIDEYLKEAARAYRKQLGKGRPQKWFWPAARLYQALTLPQSIRRGRHWQKVRSVAIGRTGV